MRFSPGDERVDVTSCGWVKLNISIRIYIADVTWHHSTVLHHLTELTSPDITLSCCMDHFTELTSPLYRSGDWPHFTEVGNWRHPTVLHHFTELTLPDITLSCWTTLQYWRHLHGLTLSCCTTSLVSVPATIKRYFVSSILSVHSSATLPWPMLSIRPSRVLCQSPIVKFPSSLYLAPYFLCAVILLLFQCACMSLGLHLCIYKFLILCISLY